MNKGIKKIRFLKQLEKKFKIKNKNNEKNCFIKADHLKYFLIKLQNIFFYFLFLNYRILTVNDEIIFDK